MKKSRSEKTKKKPLVSVVIPNYNGRQFLSKCIKSILRQSFKDFEIVVVDDKSPDCPFPEIRQEFKKEIAKGQLRLFENPENYGFAKNCNVGTQKSLGQYIVLLNNDTTVEKDWLKGLVDTITLKTYRGREIMIVGSYGWNRDTKEFVDQYWKKDKLRTTMNLCGELVSRPQEPSETKKQIHNVFFIGGLSMMFKKAEFPQPFDDEYIAYAEDNYAGWLAQIKGGCCVSTYSSRVSHYGGGSWFASKKNSRRAMFHGSKNQILNFLLFYEKKNIVRVLPLFLFVQLAHIVYSPKKIGFKFAAYGWILTHPISIIKKRGAIQKKRRVPDKEIMKNMSSKFMAEEFVSSPSQKKVVRVMNRLFYMYSRLVGLKTCEYFDSKKRELGKTVLK